MKTALAIWGIGVGATFVLFVAAAWTTRHNPDEYDDP